jgi:hypothetical protein
MLSFFRKVRKNLSESNKPWTYLRYAVGEILLIVVGILLALYLNNLNEKKKTRQEQIKVLRELTSNLNNTMEAFKRTVNMEKAYLAFNEEIIDHLDRKLPYAPELDMAFGTYYWNISSNPVTGAYDHLKSKGFDLIENDSLRKEISYLFESEFVMLREENQFWSNSFQQNISYPYHVKHFRKYYPEDTGNGSYEYAKPFDYDALMQDPYFLSINTEIISNRKWNINSLENLMVKITHLKSQISKELNQLE